MSAFSQDNMKNMAKTLQEIAQPLLDAWWKDFGSDNGLGDNSKNGYTTVNLSDPNSMNCEGVYFRIGNMLSFVISRYPSCCSTSILHKFAYSDRLNIMPKEQVLPEIIKIIDACFICLRGDSYLCSNRAQIMMVEFSGRLNETRDKTTVVPNIGNDEIRKNLHFPLFWDYFQSKHVESHRAHINPNTGRIIHNLEVHIK